jgi:uncharacterized glyoxalase superfamily protein PhnB/uncharacterized protein YndB with AHSA1/START domain
MTKAILSNFLVDKGNKKIIVDRGFDAPLDLVWAAWTESDILDQWWAPKPYQVTTKSQDLREGGRWFYLMSDPEGKDAHWCLAEYKKVIPQTTLSWLDAFCDEAGNINQEFPRSLWSVSFKGNGQTTEVNVTITYKELSDLEKILSFGFKEGFSAGMDNLDQYINSQFYLRKQNRPHKARVSMYVNFDGKTEEAFNFYRSVFKTEFINGIKRFGELPPDPNQPPIADKLKKMVLHVELPLVGGHILMGTDAPKEMGFTVVQGNNMHIQIEPESKKEADRIFKELSAGGKIEMPIQDMFWGAYFGSFTDRYGINWMINFQQ